MLYREDIEAAIERINLSGIEDAFRALVGYPNEDGIEDPDEVMLMAVCEALSGNGRIMQSGTIDAINNVTRAEASEGLKPGTTYEAGADVVTREIARFAALFGGDAGG